MNNLETFMEYITSIKNVENIELELKLFIDKKYEKGKLININYTNDEIKTIYKKIFNTLYLQYSMNDTQFVNLISQDGINKQFEYKNGEKINDSKKFYIKKRLKDTYITYSPLKELKDDITWKVKACTEEDLNNDSVQQLKLLMYKLIRFKRRFSATMIENWRIDYTFVIQLEYNVQESIIKNAKNTLFKSPINDLFNIANSIEIEIEYIGHFKNNISKILNDINKIIATFSDYINDVNIKSINMIYTDHLNLLKKIFNKMENNKKASIKHILPQVSDLTKKEYYHMINDVTKNNTRNFYITNKIDGERVILFISQNDIFTNGYITTNNWVNLEISNCKFSAIFDCELYQNSIYVFDVLWYGMPENILNMYMCPFELRLKLLLDIKFGDIVIKNKESRIYINLKQFEKFDINYKEKIQNVLNYHTKDNAEKQDTIAIDGLIFTEAKSPYISTIYYKWKPSNCLSIDFIAKKCPEQLLGISPYIKKKKQTLYFLFVGIRSDMCKSFNIKKIQYYNNIFGYISRTDYYPIQFSPSSDKNAYLFWNENSELDNKIVELVRNNNEWKLLRIRDDRQNDYNNLQYFGNDYLVAEMIWNKYNNPFLENQLLLPLDEFKKLFYFIEDNSEEHKTIRYFNNYVKQQLIKTRCANASSLIDIGAGKGQDFLKYLKNNIQSIVFMDSNCNNIDEIINRKYLYYKQGHFRNISVNINVLNCDAMTDQFIINAKAINDKYKIIICSFAIHYMVKNANTAEHFAKNISEILDKGGCIIITYLNGKKVFDKLQEQGGSSWNKGKYSIKKNFITKKYTGSNQKIKIKLPFSDGYYEEYLFDIDNLVNKFKSKKITEEFRGGFRDYIKQFMSNSKNKIYILEPDDIEYISLLEYIILYRK